MSVDDPEPFKKIHFINNRDSGAVNYTELYSVRRDHHYDTVIKSELLGENERQENENKIKETLNVMVHV